jgi:hypothetical protein
MSATCNACILRLSTSDSAGHVRGCFSVVLCVRTGGRYGNVAAVGRCPVVTGLDGVPAAAVIRRDLLVAAPGVPDGHLVVPWVRGRSRGPIMGACKITVNGQSYCDEGRNCNG